MYSRLRIVEWRLHRCHSILLFPLCSAESAFHMLVSSEGTASDPKMISQRISVKPI